MALPNCKSSDNSWSFATKWTIAGGSPSTVVNCVSSPERQTESGESVNSTTVRRTPLLLKPPSDNSSPCAIKISFMQSHKIKKVNVRSTAQAYEVHYTPALESNDVYLCTVECAMASKEEDVLHASNNKEIRAAISGNSKASNEETTSESDSDSTKEWVVVGSPASPPDQVFYEAAMKIKDVDPCISLTLRLLSPNSKALIHIDEVCVFTDALEPSDSDKKISQGENSAGCSLMKTLAPKLSQLSMSGVGCLQAEHAPSVVDEQGTRSGTPGLTESASGAELDGNCKTPDQPIPSPKRVQASDKEEKHDSRCCQVEKVLEQLLARAGKIECLFSIFEKNTLKPIINMEARLKKVEQYMELLAKNSKCPASLMTESNSSAFQNGNPSPNKTCKPADDTSTSINSSKFVPRLVVTAPSFSCDEDENKEDICLSKPQIVFSLGHEKKTFSVADDLNSFSGLNIQSPDSPLSFFRPSSLHVGSVPFTTKIDEKEIGQPAENRQHVLESLLGGFGQARQLGTGVPKSASNTSKNTFDEKEIGQPAENRQHVLESLLGGFGQARQLGTGVPKSASNASKNTFGCGFSGYMSNGFSKTAAQGGTFASQASPANDFRGPTSASGGGFTTRATDFGVPSTGSGGGFTTHATDFGFPATASGGGFTSLATRFGVPTSDFGGFTSATDFGFPATASGGAFTAPANSFGVPTSGSGGGFTAPATSFGVPTTTSGGGFTDPATNFGVPATASGGGFATRAANFFASGGGLTAPANIFGVPETASGGGFTAPATSFSIPTTASGGGFFASATNFGIPTTASGGGFTAPAASFGVPTTASAGGFTAPTNNCGVPAPASATNIGVGGTPFIAGFNLSGGFGGLSNQQGSNAFSNSNYGPTGIPPELFAQARK